MDTSIVIFYARVLFVLTHGWLLCFRQAWRSNISAFLPHNVTRDGLVWRNLNPHHGNCSMSMYCIISDPGNVIIVFSNPSGFVKGLHCKYLSSTVYLMFSCHHWDGFKQNGKWGGQSCRPSWLYWHLNPYRMIRFGDKCRLKTGIRPVWIKSKINKCVLDCDHWKDLLLEMCCHFMGRVVTFCPVFFYQMDTLRNWGWPPVTWARSAVIG